VARDAAGLTDAEARVERLFASFSRADVPVWSGIARTSDPGVLEDARDVARLGADAAGRGDLLGLSLERVALAYAHHLGGLGYWTAVFAVPVPLDARDRAISQSIVDDLVTAVIVEDVIPDEVAETLRADGETMMRWAVTGGGPDDSEHDGGTPIDPFRGPLVAATPTRGLILLTLYSWELAVVAIILRPLSRWPRALLLAVLLGSLAFVLVAGMMQEV
jgi:hypothetical protein